ncbi:Branched-chain amino acid ABC transporter, amino acid-binding protein [Caenispirillum salinarum AK4]|uniref:Branched-chain amino acid ABC transporter, amino acid-binding protein n=1 Tax=Caenispirillum salinarum AK4 TaxID=1238182 RepID=K9H0C9_9PROT|nr:ABC transporter substrate-binding protein [Caenispirillum salinarum]EKV31640.1 Branched-chain amino acid ABC transporter, amino acid-binding protein [Caenispirillum salinarum AK4]
MTLKHTRRTFMAAVAALGVAAAASLPGNAQAADEPIKIGTFLSVTGPASFLGDPELKTLQMYVDKINAEGGVNGQPLELVHYDTGGDPNKAVTFVKRLIAQDEVDAIVGGSTSGESLAVMPLMERFEVPFISFAGSKKIVDPVQAWTFKTPHTDTMACEKIFEDMKKRGFTQIAMISGTGGFGQSMQAECQGVAPDYGIEILADETYGPKDTDMTAQLTSIKNTPGVQAVLNPGFGQGPAIVTKNYRQLQIDAPLYQSHGVASKKFIELAGDAAEGVRLPAAALLVAEQLSDDDPQKPVVTGYKAAYEEKHGEGSVSTFGGHAYDGLMLIVDAMKTAGSSEPQAVRDALENTKGYMGTAGEVNFSENDHLGLTPDAFRMLEIRNGDWVLVDDTTG